jgi:hypothetical protein
MSEYVQTADQDKQRSQADQEAGPGAGAETQQLDPFVPNMDGPEVEVAATHALANQQLDQPERDIWNSIKGFFSKKKKEQPDPTPEVVSKVVGTVTVVAMKKKEVAQAPKSTPEPSGTSSVVTPPTTPVVTTPVVTTPVVTPPSTTPESTTPVSTTAPKQAPPLTPLEQVKKEIADAHADKALELLKTQSPGVRATVWKGLNDGERKGVATLINKGTMNDGLLKELFDATPDSDLASLYRMFDVRFGVTVGQSKLDTGADWDAVGLRRCWVLLKDLPEEHVRGNKWLALWTRYAGGGSAGGYYAEGHKESSMSYGSDKMDSLNGAADKGDPLYRVVRFDKVVRHEVGHAVDKAVGGSAAYCMGNSGGGKWEDHGSPTLPLVETIVAAAGGAISKLKDEHKALVMGAILKAMKAGAPDQTKTNIQKLAITKAPKKGEKAEIDATELAKILADPTVATSETSGTGMNPWYNAPGQGVDVGGRHYQASYGKTWVSYEKSSLARKVSTYQHRAPGEWFAEAYATYFQPDKEGKIGTLLAARDAGTKTWFDANVLPQEKKEVAPVVPEKKETPEPDSSGGNPGKKG